MNPHTVGALRVFHHVNCGVGSEGATSLSKSEMHTYSKSTNPRVRVESHFVVFLFLPSLVLKSVVKRLSPKCTLVANQPTLPNGLG